MVLVMMESSGELDLTNNQDNFSVSWVTKLYHMSQQSLCRRGIIIGFLGQ